MYEVVKKTKSTRRYMEDLALHTGAPTLQCEYKSFISFIEAKIFTSRAKLIDIHLCFLQEQFYNDIFVPKYEKYSVMP